MQKNEECERLKATAQELLDKGFTRHNTVGILNKDYGIPFGTARHYVYEYWKDLRYDEKKHPKYDHLFDEGQKLLDDGFSRKKAAEILDEIHGLPCNSMEKYFFGYWKDRIKLRNVNRRIFDEDDAKVFKYLAHTLKKKNGQFRLRGGEARKVIAETFGCSDVIVWRYLSLYQNEKKYEKYLEKSKRIYSRKRQSHFREVVTELKDLGCRYNPERGFPSQLGAKTITVLKDNPEYMNFVKEMELKRLQDYDYRPPKLRRDPGRKRFDKMKKVCGYVKTPWPSSYEDLFAKDFQIKDFLK